MGTNYYAHRTLDFDSDDEVVHLGKLSMGWMPVIPQRTIAEWLDVVGAAERLTDEYGRNLSPNFVVGRFVRHSLKNPKVGVGHGFPNIAVHSIAFETHDGEFS